MIKNFNYLFVTFFGIGTFRFASGTITSLITTVLLYSLLHIINLPNYFILLFLIIILFCSFYAVAEYIKESEDKDPKEVVIDEVIGQTIPIYLFEIAHGNEKTLKKSYYFIYIFLSYLDFLISKNPFQSIFSIKNLKIVLVSFLTTLLLGFMLY